MVDVRSGTLRSRRCAHRAWSLIVAVTFSGTVVHGQSIPACGTVPYFGCKEPTQAERGTLVLHSAGASLTWKWRSGDTTSMADLGNPLVDASYRLCVHDLSGASAGPVLEASAPAGGSCGGRSCWSQTGSGFRYVNKTAAADGIAHLTLTTGTAGRAKITVKGIAPPLGFPSLPLGATGPVVAQLINSNGTCWEARYVDSPTTNDAIRYKHRATAGTGRYGVHASQGQRPQTLTDVTDLGGGWMRLNYLLDDPSPPNLHTFLDTGQNLIITVVNRQRDNIDTSLGSADTYPNAGFPYLSEAVYQARITALLDSLHDEVTAGRRVFLQCENEIGDASLASGSPYWRGTTDQYLATLRSFFDAVRGAQPSVGVLLSSFASNTLATALNIRTPGQPGYANYVYATTLLGRLLNEGTYDLADLHFYGCPSSIADKVGWVNDRWQSNDRPPLTRRWVTTENAGPDYVECAGAPRWQDTAFATTQANEVTERLTACADASATVCLWFSLYDLVGETDRFNHLGLIDPRTVPPTQRPAYAAFKTFTATHR